MPHDTLTVDPDTARTIIEALEQLTAGDIVTFQSGISDRTVVDADRDGNGMWVLFTDTEDNTDTLTATRLFASSTRLGDAYDWNEASIRNHNFTNTGADVSIGRITNATVSDADTDEHPDADIVVSLDWSLTPAALYDDIIEHLTKIRYSPRQAGSPDV